MIGKPTNFQHLCHVGFNPEAGFVSDEANHKELQAHFASVCVTPDLLFFSVGLLVIDFYDDLCTHLGICHLQYEAMTFADMMHC